MTFFWNSSLARIGRPVIIASRASAGPHSRTTYFDIVAGTRPRLTSERVNFWFAPTTIRMSQQNASPTPPPKHPPLTSAIVVLGHVLTHSNVDSKFASCAFVVPDVAGPDELRSMPVQKYFPVLVRTMTWTVGSEDRDDIVVRRCWTMDAVRTLPFLGLLRVIVAAEGDRETRRRSEDGGDDSDLALVVVAVVALDSGRLA